MLRDITFTFNTAPTQFQTGAALYIINHNLKQHLHFSGDTLCPLFPSIQSPAENSLGFTMCVCLQCDTIFKDPSGPGNGKYAGLTRSRSSLFFAL